MFPNNSQLCAEPPNTVTFYGSTWIPTGLVTNWPRCWLDSCKRIPFQLQSWKSAPAVLPLQTSRTLRYINCAQFTICVGGIWDTPVNTSQFATMVCHAYHALSQETTHRSQKHTSKYLTMMLASFFVTLNNITITITIQMYETTMMLTCGSIHLYHLVN